MKLPSARRQQVIALVVGAGAWSLAGCDRDRDRDRAGDHDRDHATDAGAEQTTPLTRYAGPFETHVVARTLTWRTALVPLDDGRVVMTAGFYRFDLTSDGTAKLIGPPSSYAAKMPSADIQLAGYDVVSVTPDETVPGARAWHDLRGPLTGRARPEHFAVSDVDNLPSGVAGDDMRRAADGTLVFLVNQATSDTGFTFVAAPKSRHVIAVPIDGLDDSAEAAKDARRRGVTCEHVPSWGRPHLFCRSWHDGITSVVRLAGRHWEIVPVTAEIAAHLRVGAVGPDDTLWLGLRTGAVLRRAANGATEIIEMPRASTSLARPSYTSSPAGYARRASDSDGLQLWERVGITAASAAGASDVVPQIRQIVPRPDGEAWVLTAESHATHLLVHVSRPAIAPLEDPLLVGSEADQRNELRNLTEPVTWVGHCPQLFVTLAKERADGSFAPEPVWSRETQIADVFRGIVGKARHERPISMIVEGRLGGRRVAGVMLWRADPDASEDLLERAAAAIASELSPLTGATPRITCTVPVLERTSKSPF
jgi:hypothetical protein